MLYDTVDDPGSMTPAELRATYEAELASVIDDEGVDRVAEVSDVDRATIEALAADESPDGLTLSEVAAILAVADGTPDADAIAAEMRDHLLMGMSTAVLDVDTVAAELDGDLSGKEVQQLLEGRSTASLADVAAIHQLIAERGGGGF